jgi:hypothetical protein
LDLFAAFEGKTHAMARRTLLAFCLLLMAAFCQAQTDVSGRGGSATASVSETLRRQLLKLVPDSLPAQAHAQGSATFYGANLWEYIDGAAEQYQLYGLDGMIHQEFKAGKIDVTMDIYCMGQTENAFGIYATERSAASQFVSIGTEGVFSRTSDGDSALNFLSDRYYVKLTGFGTGSDAVIEAFAREIAGRIGAHSGWPVLLGKLPDAHRVPHSELYVLSNPLGHDYLSPAYSIKYQLDKTESTLVVSVAADEAGAKSRLALLEKHFRQSGQCTSASEFGDGAIRGKTSYEGEMLARTVGRYLVLMVNPAGSAAEVFRDTLTRLK